jgi:hypothetical protein
MLLVMLYWYTVRSESRCALTKRVESYVHERLNPFNVIRKHFPQICFRKFAVHLKRLLEVMSTSVYTGMNLFTSRSQVHSDFSNVRYYDARSKNTTFL